MKLPNPDRAIVDIAKLRTYSLDPAHPDGGHKALVFDAVLGLTGKDAEWLRQRLLHVVFNEATATGETKYGKRYVIDFELHTAMGRAMVRSSWIVLREEDFPRLTTCFVRRKR